MQELVWAYQAESNMDFESNVIIQTSYVLLVDLKTKGTNDEYVEHKCFVETASGSSLRPVKN